MKRHKQGFWSMDILVGTCGGPDEQLVYFLPNYIKFSPFSGGLKFVDGWKQVLKAYCWLYCCTYDIRYKGHPWLRWSIPFTSDVFIYFNITVQYNWHQNSSNNHFSLLVLSAPSSACGCSAGPGKDFGHSSGQDTQFKVRYILPT